ncbi:MAG: nucleotide exchange factor GrpE [Solirubrobacterales bacterium]
MTAKSEGQRSAGAPEQGRRHDAVEGERPADAAEGERPPGVEQNSEAAAKEVERDLEALEETRRERDEYLELAQRTKADFENYRKRVAGEAESARRRGKSELAAELVPVVDNLERGLVAAGIDPAAALSGDAATEGALEQGVVLTYRDLNETLRRAGVEPYEPAGEEFDPEWHEAVSTRAAEGTDPGVVLDVVQKGYRLDGRVIRAARVVVSE